MNIKSFSFFFHSIERVCYRGCTWSLFQKKIKYPTHLFQKVYVYFENYIPVIEYLFNLIIAIIRNTNSISLKSLLYNFFLFTEKKIYMERIQSEENNSTRT